MPTRYAPTTQARSTALAWRRACVPCWARPRSPAIARTRTLAQAARRLLLTAPAEMPSGPRNPETVNATPGDDAAALAPARGDGSTQTGASGASRVLRRAAATIAPPRAAATRTRTRPPGTRTEPSAARLQPSDDGQPPGRAHAIDEWDYQQQRLMTGWCTLIERRQHGGDTAFIHSVRRRHAELARRVHHQFAAWRPEGLQRVHGASDGDEVELDRVIEAMVDRRAGLFDDRAWYVRRDRAQRDVATALLVDTSASTDFALPDAVVGPPRAAPTVAVPMRCTCTTWR